MAGSGIQSSQDAKTRTSDGHGSVYNAEHQIELFATFQGEVWGFLGNKNRRAVFCSAIFVSIYPLGEL